MFARLTIHASDRAASERFYATVLATLGLEDAPDFAVAQAEGGRVTRGLHIGFVAPSREHVDEFWRVGTAAGYRDDGAPGPRPQYTPDYYGSFLLDPDGNSAEAVHHGDLRRGGAVDHLWIRVDDIAAAKPFYESLARPGAMRLETDRPDHAQLVGETGSFSLIRGTPVTEHLDLRLDG
jgi:catechol 2,3-dioxygenase-like lactoylglutathione lyase family enzyme